MNHSKKGDILYKDMWQAARNADWVRHQNKNPKYHYTEEQYLKIVVAKAEARLQQIKLIDSKRQVI